ncbi:hypothetical protein ILUMI_05727 [Ignelater luminosus]|uniref:Uncharacterized protein n=1 Tax=Ignelater luminosus TaxID=2038154 RepID=A0A8K0DCG1_IGNLU|nr:hypothetical protein ILUMI_05727 [Ignelater luminosus]
MVLSAENCAKAVALVKDRRSQPKRSTLQSLIKNVLEKEECLRKHLKNHNDSGNESKADNDSPKYSSKYTVRQVFTNEEENELEKYINWRKKTKTGRSKIHTEKDKLEEIERKKLLKKQKSISRNLFGKTTNIGKPTTKKFKAKEPSSSSEESVTVSVHDNCDDDLSDEKCAGVRASLSSGLGVNGYKDLQFTLQDIPNITRLTEVRRTLEEAELVKAKFVPPSRRNVSSLEPGLVYHLNDQNLVCSFPRGTHSLACSATNDAKGARPKFSRPIKEVSEVKCWKCNAKGHVQRNCKGAKRRELVIKRSHPWLVDQQTKVSCSVDCSEWQQWLDVIKKFCKVSVQVFEKFTSYNKKSDMTLVRKRNDNRPNISVEMFGQSVVALLDSGASNSCIGGLGLHLITLFGLQVYQCTDLGISTADGSSQEISGYINVSIKLGDVKFNFRLDFSTNSYFDGSRVLPTNQEATAGEVGAINKICSKTDLTEKQLLELNTVIEKFLNPTDRLARWVMRLSQYDMKLVHRRGILHVAPDALSRALVETCVITGEVSADKWHSSVLERVQQSSTDYPDWEVRGGLLYKHLPNDFGIRTNLSEWKLVVPRNQTHFVRKCHTCKAQKVSTSLLPGFMGKPKSQYVSVDILGRLPKSKNGHQYLLVVPDYFTKYCLLHPMGKPTGTSVVNFIKKQVFFVVDPSQILGYDNGVHFCFKAFSD